MNAADTGPARGLGQTAEPIAIVGMGCRFPGASGLDAYWSLLADGREAIVPVPPGRWNRAALYHDDPVNAPGTIRTGLGGFLSGIEMFDPGFFGISPREAGAIDPQQRLLLETAYEAFEDAGIDAFGLKGEKVGVFVGIAAYDYAEIQHGYENRHLIGPHTNTGLALSIASNRISYIFDFRGPSVSVDTACSSSLVAVHLACRSLETGESRMALAGGVNAILKPEATIGFSRASMLAPDGRSKTFDARANGYARGEGAGVVVLKRLADAIADGDRIHAVIRGTAVNQDGRTNGMSVPSQEAQEAALREALARAGIDPADIGYVEAHGTGTPVGDPIEARALGAVLGQGRPEGRPCRVGSVKTNIGHLESAAGIAGLIKAALVVERRHIPASLNFKTPNPAIPFDALRLSVAAVGAPWPAGDGPARAGVNSFGFGGTNAHVVLEEPPPATGDEAAAGRGGDGAAGAPLLLAVSARTPEALRTLVGRYADHLSQRSEDPAALQAVCRSAALRRGHHACRWARAARSAGDLIAALRKPVDPKAAATGAPVFVYSGMGGQWWAMGRQLLETEPVFLEGVSQCDRLFGALSGRSLLTELRADEGSSGMGRTEVSQPCNLALQVGLTLLWRSWGIEPAAIVGHSAGEIAATWAAGILSLEDALSVAYHRSRLQQRVSGRGRMVAVGLSEAEARDRIAPYAGTISVAAVNGPAAVTLSGDSAPLDELAAALEAEGRFAKAIRVDVPYHSHHMDGLEAELRAGLAGLSPRPPAVPFYSTVTGRPLDGIAVDADYWWRNVRDPVAFARAIGRIAEDGHTLFLEVGPHPVLANAVADCLSDIGVKGTVLTSLKRQTDEQVALRESLAALYELGRDVAWDGLYPGTAGLVDLPPYPWQHQPYWTESARSRSARLGGELHPLLGGRLDAGTTAWENLLDIRVLNGLADHRVEQAAVFPGAGYVELALAVASREMTGGAPAVEDVAFERALLLPEAAPVRLSVTFDAETAEVAVHSAEEGGSWNRHTRCRIRQTELAPDRDDLPALRASFGRPLTDPYARFQAIGLDYGPAFQGIDALWQGGDGALARLRPLSPETVAAYHLPPALLDAGFQTLLGVLASADGLAGAFLPVSIDRVLLLRPIPAGVTLWAHARGGLDDPGTLSGDIRLLDDDGLELVRVSGFRGRSLARTAATGEGDHFYRFQWRSEGAATPADGLTSPTEVAAALAPRLADIVDAPERGLYYRDIEPALNVLSARLAEEALSRLGIAFADDALFESGAAGAMVAPRHQRLLGRLIAMLEAEGRLRREGGGWRVVPGRQQAGADGTALAAAVDALIAPLLAAHPIYAPELEILRAGARHLPDILTGVTDPLQVLFPDGSQNLTERVYRDSRTFGVYNALAREAVRRLVATLPSDATLNVVEIGGGTGSLTAAVLDLLPPSRTRYLFTDVSAAFVQKAGSRFGSWGFVDFAVFDLEADPAGQGLAPGRAHLVLAADVLHATSDIGRSLRHVRSLLAPGGQLLALELTRPPFWFDLVFGLLSGWWGFSDSALRPDHACLSGTAWRTCLTGAGFDDIALLADGDDPDASVHSVILARSPAPAEETATGEAAGTDDVLTTDAGDLWLVLEDDGHVGAGLDRELGGGGRVSSSPAGAVLDRESLAAATADRQGILFLGASASSLRDEMAPRTVMEITGGLCARLLALLQTLADGGAGAARLVVVTRGAMAVLPGDEVDPGQAALWGLTRVFMNEHPDVPCGLVDLSGPAGPSSGPDTIAPVELRALADLCRAGADDEQERALRGAGRFLHRLDRIAPDHLAPGADRRRRTGEPVRLDFTRTGAFEHLLVRSAGPSRPGPDEVEIEAAAAGLNFRDIMKLLGIYPTEHDERPVLGDECAGTVLSVGARVDRFKPGDRVVAIGSGFSSRLSVDHRLVARLPDGVDFAGGATLPIVFLTAHYALRHLAGLEPGERVLIHAGAGGVGQAAIQIAKGAGARIFATAGSEEKRAYLRGMGIADVFDSRSLDFAQQIMAVTDGQGVDVVLNSLSGRAIEKSLGLLGPYGRFLEIGKTDIYRDSRIGLRPFRRNLSYFAIDLDAILHQRRDLARRLLDEVMVEASAGRIVPLPHSTFPLRDAPRAFRHMAQARHIGKVVLDLTDPEVAVAPRRFEALPLAGDATYLVTGGLGGVGRSLARWMVDQGARHLVLLGRGAGSDEARAFCASLSGPGTLVEARACDVTDDAALSGELDRLRARGRPIRGVIHAAMVLDDGLIPQLDSERLNRVLAPKIAGAWALDRATAADPLDFFVMFSSFASLVGNIGQANYSAANAFLDALAERRRRQGRPALTVNWGAIGAVGYVADHAEIEQHFQRLGLQSMEPAAAFRALETLLRWDAAGAGVVDIDWAGWSRHAPAIAKSARFRHLIEDDGPGSETGAGEAILDRLRDASSEERPVILLGAVREQLAAVLGLSPDEVDASQAPSALGLDSLMAVEFSCLIEDRLGFKPATLELIQAPSLAALVDRFSEKIAI